MTSADADHMELFTTWSDEVRLTGALWATGEHARCVVFCPGMSGNVLDNSFTWLLAENCVAAGWDFVYGHNRGWGLMSDTLKCDGDWMRGGAAYTSFESGVSDTAHWLQWATERYQMVVAVGHSLGGPHLVAAAKTVTALAGIALLSPADMPTVAPVIGQPERDEQDLEAAQLTAEGTPGRLLSGLLWDWYPISAKTYLELRSPGGPADVFPVSRPKELQQALAHIAVPLFVAYGENDDTYIVDPASDVATIVACAPAATAATGTVIAGANHVYDPGAKGLAEELLNWLMQLP